MTPDQPVGQWPSLAKGGKPIGIVTHVRRIAEQIDTVLRVERRATGSEIRRLEGAELAAFMEDEVRSGRQGCKRCEFDYFVLVPKVTVHPPPKTHRLSRNT